MHVRSRRVSMVMAAVRDASILDLLPAMGAGAIIDLKRPWNLPRWAKTRCAGYRTQSPTSTRRPLGRSSATTSSRDLSRQVAGISKISDLPIRVVPRVPILLAAPVPERIVPVLPTLWRWKGPWPMPGLEGQVTASSGSLDCKWRSHLLSRCALPLNRIFAGDYL